MKRFVSLASAMMLGTVLAGVHSFEKPAVAHASKNSHKAAEYNQVQTHKSHHQAPREATSVTTDKSADTSVTTVAGEVTSVTSRDETSGATTSKTTQPG